MAIPEEYKPLVLAYCREPEPSDADLMALNQAWDSAEGYLEGAGVTRPRATGRAALWLSVMCALVLDEYDQRGAQFAENRLQDNPVFRRKLNQLKLTEPASVADAGSGEG